MPAHSHDYAEILFVEKGRGVHEVNGELQPITRGDLILIRPFIDTHCIRDSDPNLSILHVAVRASSVRFLETRYFDANSKFWGGAGKSPMILALSNRPAGVDRGGDAPALRLSAEPVGDRRFLLELVEALRGAPPSIGRQQLTDWLQKACEMIEDPQSSPRAPRDSRCWRTGPRSTFRGS